MSRGLLTIPPTGRSGDGEPVFLRRVLVIVKPFAVMILIAAVGVLVALAVFVGLPMLMP